MYDENLLRQKISALRIKKHVSAREMSLSIGQTPSYINKIENKKCLPSMDSFFAICDYFGVTPSEFFNDNVKNPDTCQLFCQIQKLSPNQYELVKKLVDELVKNENPMNRNVYN